MDGERVGCSFSCWYLAEIEGELPKYFYVISYPFPSARGKRLFSEFFFFFFFCIEAREDWLFGGSNRGSCNTLPGMWCVMSLSHVRLFDPMDYGPLGSSVHGILQARILEWVAIPFSRGFFWLRGWILISCNTSTFLNIWATMKAPCPGDTWGNTESQSYPVDLVVKNPPVIQENGCQYLVFLKRLAHILFYLHLLPEVCLL